MTTERHVFPGGNTAEGFYSFYDYMINRDDANKIIILKGGPGTGKSSLMKKLGQYYSSRGYSIEYHHCSSDNNSLDGIVVEELKVCVLDGTSPHIVDPKYPGCVDEIINLGLCWNEEGILSFKENIMNITKCISDHFNRAYRFFRSAKALHEDWTNFNKKCLNLNQIDKLILKFNFDLPISTNIENRGKDRHLFSTAFTPNGIVTYIDSLYIDYNNITVLYGGPGLGKTTILQSVANTALSLGLDVEFYHHPLNKNKLEHILIPQASMAILSSNELNKKSFELNTINMEELCNQELLSKAKAEIIYDEIKFNEILNKGLNCIREAKSLHDKLETYYTPNMDFTKIHAVYEEILKKVSIYERI